MTKEFRLEPEAYTWLIQHPDTEEALELLGSKMGFLAATVQSVPGKGPRIFTAEPAEANPGGGAEGDHLIGSHFKSHKYPWCEVDFVPLKLTDKMAQPLLWMYAEKRKVIDLAFAKDLQTALIEAGYEPPST